MTTHVKKQVRSSPDLSHSPITHKRDRQNARLQFHLLSDWLLQCSLCWPTKVYYQPSRLRPTCCGSYDIWPLQTRSYNLCTKRWAALAACIAALDIQALSHHLQSHQRHCTQLHCCYVRAFVNEPGSSTPTFFWLMSATSPADQNWARKMGLRVCRTSGMEWLADRPANINNSHRVSRPLNTSFSLLLFDLLNMIKMAVSSALCPKNLDRYSISYSLFHANLFCRLWQFSLYSALVICLTNVTTLYKLSYLIIINKNNNSTTPGPDRTNVDIYVICSREKHQVCYGLANTSRTLFKKVRRWPGFYLKFGSKDQEEKFHTELQTCRQSKDETIQSLYTDTCRLMCLTNPDHDSTISQ